MILVRVYESLTAVGKITQAHLQELSAKHISHVLLLILLPSIILKLAY